MALLSGIVTIGILCFVVLNIDLYSYCDAIPPAGTERIESSRLTSQRISLDGKEFGTGQISVNTNATIQLTGEVQLNWNEWRDSSMEAVVKRLRVGRSTASKVAAMPSALVQVQIVRQSWLTPYECVEVERISKVKPSGDSSGTWSVAIPLTNLRGVYRVRVKFGQKYLQDRVPISDARLIAVHDLKVEE